MANVRIVYQPNTFGPWKWHLEQQNGSKWESVASSVFKAGLQLKPGDVLVSTDDGPEDPPANPDGSRSFYEKYPDGTYTHVYIPAPSKC